MAHVCHPHTRRLARVGTMPWTVAAELGCVRVRVGDGEDAVTVLGHITEVGHIVFHPPPKPASMVALAVSINGLDWHSVPDVPTQGAPAGELPAFSPPQTSHCPRPHTRKQATKWSRGPRLCTTTRQVLWG